MFCVILACQSSVPKLFFAAENVDTDHKNI